MIFIKTSKFCFLPQTLQKPFAVGIVGAVKNRKIDRRFEISSEDSEAHSTSNIHVQHNDVHHTEFTIRTSKGVIRDDQKFGKADWETYYAHDVGVEPPLPDDIDETLNSPCPIAGEEGIMVKHTHMLVLVPATVEILIGHFIEICSLKGGVPCLQFKRFRR